MKSPECRITPCGVWKAVAKPCGTEWVTGMNSTSKGPIWRRSPSVDLDEARPVGEARLFDPVPGQPEGEGRAVHGHRQVAQQEGQAAGVVLVAVGQDHRFDGVGPVAQVRQVREHEVDAGHVGLGEHDPAVEDDDAAVELDARAVAADLPEAAQEDDANRIRQATRPRVHRQRRARRARGCEITVRARSSSSGGAAPSGSRHWPAGRPRARHAALAGSGFGNVSLDSKS